MANRADSLTRQCSEDGCEKPLRARGLCSTHYNQTNFPQRHQRYAGQCVMCDSPITYSSGGGRKYGPVCSPECRRRVTFGWSEPLPDDHWARWYGTTCEWKPPAVKLARFTNGQCAECGAWFTADTHGSPIDYCSRHCQRRVNKRVRRAREHEADGGFRYVELMRIYQHFDGRCAYCDEAVVGLPDPEHVIPLSRGGRNDIGNLLPACRTCNADKNDMTPSEWSETRATRGLPPVRTDFPFDDDRFRHLVSSAPTRPRWEDRQEA